MDIHLLYRQCCSVPGISRKLGITHNTLRRYLRDTTKAPDYGPRAAKLSKLDAFPPDLRERIEAVKSYSI